MRLVGGVHHVTFLTEDIDRLVAFGEIRRRLQSEAALDGEVRDMRTMWILGFQDPDGFYVEVIWRKPDSPDSETLERAHWTAVQLG